VACEDRAVLLIDELASEAGIRLDVRGALALVATRDADRLLDACLARYVRLLGAEAFVTEQHDLRSTGDILDLSTLRNIPHSVAEGRQFVLAVGSDSVSFDFTLLEPPLDDAAYLGWTDQGTAELSELLYWNWDPLGVRTAFPDTVGEYGRYATELVEMLRIGVADGELAASFAEWERDSIGAPVPSTSDKLETLERCVFDWYDRSTVAWRRRRT
jgi:hypothetical protein